MWYIHKFPATIYANENNSVRPIMSKAQQFNFMNLQEQLKSLSDEYGFIDPVTLLQGFANGQDLRTHNIIYEMVLELESKYGDELPDVWDYDELIELIKNEYRFLPVERGISKDAAKTLLEYMHNKKKAVEVTDKSAGGSITDLTKAEIRRFERVFKNEY